MKMIEGMPITSINFEDYLNPEEVKLSLRNKLKKLKPKQKEALMRYFVSAIHKNDVFWEVYWDLIRFTAENYLNELKVRK
jgi:hypothetical protein